MAWCRVLAFEVLSGLGGLVFVGVQFIDQVVLSPPTPYLICAKYSID